MEHIECPECNKEIEIDLPIIIKLQSERNEAIKEIGIWSRKAGRLQAELEQARAENEHLEDTMIEDVRQVNELRELSKLQTAEIKQLSEENGRLEKAISETLEENGHLADGDVCTLIKLKQSLKESGPVEEPETTNRAIHHLGWMIKTLDFQNEGTGIDSEDSPDLSDAKLLLQELNDAQK